MRVDGVRAGAGAGGPTVTAQDEYRYELLQRLRRRSLERRRSATGARDRSATGSGFDGVAADLGLYGASDGVRPRPGGDRP